MIVQPKQHLQETEWRLGPGYNTKRSLGSRRCRHRVSTGICAYVDEMFEETVRQIRAFGRRGEAVRADVCDIAALRSVADRVEEQYGKIDIVAADAAI